MSVDLAQLGKVIATLKHPCTAEVFFFWLPNTLGAGRPRSRNLPLWRSLPPTSLTKEPTSKWWLSSRV